MPILRHVYTVSIWAISGNIQSSRSHPAIQSLRWAGARCHLKRIGPVSLPDDAWWKKHFRWISSKKDMNIMNKNWYKKFIQGSPRFILSFFKCWFKNKSLKKKKKTTTSVSQVFPSLPQLRTRTVWTLVVAVSMTRLVIQQLLVAAPCCHPIGPEWLGISCGGFL